VKNKTLDSLSKIYRESSPNNVQSLTNSEQVNLDSALLRIKINAKKGYNPKGSYVPKKSKIQRHLRNLDPELGEKIQRD
jgi:hypothetical protein